jgi:polysaccharide pyruvyl transferase WcaK-like protein
LINKIIVLNRALKNSGDFLIAERFLELLIYHCPKCEVYRANAYEPLPRRIFDLLGEENTRIVIPGGPGLANNMFENLYPIVPISDLGDIPLYIFGIGTYMKQSEKINDKTKKQLMTIVNRQGYIGVRDTNSYQVLSSSRIPVKILGCPAWYNLDNILGYRKFTSRDKPFKVILTAPSLTKNFDDFIAITKKINKFLTSEISVLFNRGIFFDSLTSQKQEENNVSLISALSKTNKDIKIINGEYSTATFNLTSIFDLHIGYRVHTHVDFRSKGKISYIIKEDERAVGMVSSMDDLDLILSPEELEENFINNLSKETYLNRNNPIIANNFVGLKDGFFKTLLE